MNNQFEEKGKIFTQVISKEPNDVIIQTLTNRIVGITYIRRETRLIDSINQSEPFIAITDATVYNKNGKILYKTEFLILNLAQIIWILPAKDMQNDSSN